jgi:hypothetical protein
MFFICSHMTLASAQAQHFSGPGDWQATGHPIQIVALSRPFHVLSNLPLFTNILPDVGAAQSRRGLPRVALCPSCVPITSVSLGAREYCRLEWLLYSAVWGDIIWDRGMGALT